MSQSSSNNGRLLIVDADPAERHDLERLLTFESFTVYAVESADKALGFLDDPIDVVLIGDLPGDISSLDLLRHWKSKQPDTPVMVMSSHPTVDLAIRSIRDGACDFLMRPLDPPALLNSIRDHLAAKPARQADSAGSANSLSNIIGQSPSMQRVFELIRRSAQAFSTVLILGESGTGKELVAQAIHQNSPRRDGPFVAVNCAAMPATLVESELFGHEKGAFTGATDRHMGRFEAATGGTLFIDEIGDFDVSLQVKLLRVLESRCITPVGSNKEIKVDTRVVTATSRDIRQMMAQNTFREDLFYRLNVISIELPPLRQRLEDIPLLVQHFMERVNAQNGTRVHSVSPAFMAALQTYHWPGNVRELLNVIEGAMVLADKSQLELHDLPPFERPAPAAAATGDGSPPAASAWPQPPLYDILAAMTLDELEQRAIDAALRRCHNNRTRAARSLGISVRTLQRKLLQRNMAAEEAPGEHVHSEESAEATGSLVGSGRP